MVKKVEHCQGSGCPIACTLDIIGDHWTLLVVREMMFAGNHQYKDMLTMEEGISSNILSDRLKRLEEHGIIASAYKQGNKRDKLYYLTQKGKNLIYVMIEIARWAELNIGEKIHIPEEKRPLLDNPLQEVAEMVHKNLEAWEKKHLSEYMRI
ncbi:winged helix-turn-helix transcriptional regulator [Marinicella sp. W31]|uniref:winged helix-turn-helix transcriptional regulator n=1 Tax=Marinicella sp. W31 TaxID=3023713 RepID=UPI0037567F35